MIVYADGLGNWYGTQEDAKKKTGYELVPIDFPTEKKSLLRYLNANKVFSPKVCDDCKKEYSYSRRSSGTRKDPEQVTLSLASAFIIKNALEDYLDTKGLSFEEEDIFDADFMETTGKEARVFQRLKKLLEEKTLAHFKHQEQKRDEKEKRS